MSKLTFETHLRGVGLKGAKSLGVVRRAGKLYDCPRGLKSYLNAYGLSNLECCEPVWMSSAESRLSLPNRVVRSAERLCGGELCFWGTEGRSVPCVCSIRFITGLTTLCMSICIISLQLVILEFQLL